MTDRELLQQALDALIRWYVHPDEQALLETIRARLAQPEQEPVAWAYINNYGECEQIEFGTPDDDPDITPLYTSPQPSQKPLTDEEIKRIEETTTCVAGESWLRNLCRNIEAAHNIK